MVIMLLKESDWVSKSSLAPYLLVVTLCTTNFDIQQFYILPTEFTYVSCVDLRTNAVRG
jgi:hypothetical protein